MPLRKKFPASLQFSLTSQIQRSAVSVPSNNAEGYNRQTRKEYLQFLHIAFGSLAELETQLMIAQQQGYLSKPTGKEVLFYAAQTSKMLHGLIQKLKLPAAKPETRNPKPAA